MPDEFICPGCRTPLEQLRLEHGIFWACPQCGGRALSVELLRRTFAREAINPLWLRVLNGAGHPGRNCPCCGHAMLEVDLTEKPETPAVEVCRLCHFVWFDAREIGELPPRAIPVEPSATRKPLALAPRAASPPRRSAADRMVAATPLPHAMDRVEKRLSFERLRLFSQPDDSENGASVALPT